MFKELSELMIDGDSITLVMTKKAETLSVSVSLTKKETIPAINITGTAEEIDENFISALEAPFQTVKNVFKINTDAFEAGAKELKKKKDKEDKKTSGKTKEAKSEPPKETDPLIEMRSLMAESRFEEAKSDLEKLIPRLKGQQKKDAEALLNDARVEILKKKTNFDDVPEEIKEIAKNNPNVIIGSVASLAKEVLPEITENDDFSEKSVEDEFADEFENNPDDNF